MSSYSVYLDETGDFQGSGDLYGIFGLVWAGDADALANSLKHFCTDLSNKLINEGRDGGKAFPECLHTTKNPALKALLSDRSTDLLRSGLVDLPISITGVYSFKDEVDPADFLRDDVYLKMINSLMRHITEQIRHKDADAVITFHIPTRDTVFGIDETNKEQKYLRSDTVVGIKIDKNGGETKLSVSMNSQDTFRDIRGELGVDCSVREISYEIHSPDDDDNNYHKYKNPESTLWGYYTADIINYWMRGFANRPQKSNEDIEKELAEFLDVYLLQPYSSDIEQARRAIDHVHEDPCGYLETLENLYSEKNPTPRTEYAIQIMENPNPFTDQSLIQTAVTKIEKQYIHESRYSKAKVLLERLKILCEKAGNETHYSYSNLIVKLMTCYHHEGGNKKAQELFNSVKSTLGNDRTRALDICNKYQEFFVNTLAFEQGINFVEAALEEFKPVSAQKNLGGVTISGAGISDEEKIIQARTTSSLGSLHSYLGHKEQAEALFQKALELFKSANDNINCGITLSHYAHLLLDTEDIHSENLLSILSQYMDPGSENKKSDPDQPETWEHWLHAICQIRDEKGEFKPEFAKFPFWVWIKAINRLPVEKLKSNKDFYRILSKYPEHLEIMKLQDHPAEMIRKYHGLLAARMDDQRCTKKDLEVLEKLIQKNNQCGTIPLLCRKYIYEIKLEQKTITEEEIKLLEADAAKDINKLYNELHEGNNETQLETLIDRLESRKPLTMSDLTESLQYEFR